MISEKDWLIRTEGGSSILCADSWLKLGEVVKEISFFFIDPLSRYAIGDDASIGLILCIRNTFTPLDHDFNIDDLSVMKLNFKV